MSIHELSGVGCSGVGWIVSIWDTCIGLASDLRQQLALFSYFFPRRIIAILLTSCHWTVPSHTGLHTHTHTHTHTYTHTHTSTPHTHTHSYIHTNNQTRTYIYTYSPIIPPCLLHSPVAPYAPPIQHSRIFGLTSPVQSRPQCSTTDYPATLP